MSYFGLLSYDDFSLFLYNFSNYKLSSHTIPSYAYTTQQKFCMKNVISRA